MLPFALELAAIRERMGTLNRNDIDAPQLLRLRLAFDRLTEAHALLMVAST